MEENKDYHAYRYGDHLTPGSELKIEHSVVCENVDISTLITMGIDSLEAMRQGSIDGEQKAYEIVVAAAKQWEQQAAATQTINRALEYLRTPEIEHTGNQWKDTDNWRADQKISNRVYQMTCSIWEDTKYDRETKQSVLIAWYVTWEVRIHSPKQGYGAKIAGQNQKRYTDKNAAIKYLDGRKKAYSHLFTEISPPIPKEYEHHFMVHGTLLPGYTVEGLEQAKTEHAAAEVSEGGIFTPENQEKAYYNVSRTNGVWSTSTVLRILEDQRYIGTYVIGKRKVKEIGSRHTQLKDESEWFKIPNHHPAIVSVDLFERANASIKRFSLSNKKPRDYLLRGKVFCGCCDHAMSLRNGAWFYCRHSEVAETLPCHGVRIKMADLEQVVFETIRAQMCPALGIDSNKDKLDLQTVQQTEHEEKLRSIQDSKRYLYEQYALGEIDLETYRTRKAVYDTELVQAKNVHAVITAQTKQIKSDYEIKLKQQEIVQKVGNANMLTKALIDRLINKVYVFPGDRIEIEYATQDFLETKESEKEV